MSRTPSARSPNAGGCDFPADPDRAAGSVEVFWLPALLPDAFELKPVATASDDPVAMPIDLARLPHITLRATADDERHGRWQVGDAVHQFWIADANISLAASYVVLLPIDAFTELRALAILRFWRALVGRPPGEYAHALPTQTRNRHVLILRALDGRSDGASYRQIAETLLGFHGSKADWESDPRKNQTRRLVADGKHYMRGGYRDLLHYPLRLPRRR